MTLYIKQNARYHNINNPNFTIYALISQSVIQWNPGVFEFNRSSNASSYVENSGCDTDDIKNLKFHTILQCKKMPFSHIQNNLSNW